MLEIWKDIEGFEGLYQISNKGRVNSFHRGSNIKAFSRTSGGGWYYNVGLYKKGKGYQKDVHRLVAETFIPLVNCSLFSSSKKP